MYIAWYLSKMRMENRNLASQTTYLSKKEGNSQLPLPAMTVGFIPKFLLEIIRKAT